jgi:TonB family protein
MRLLPGQGNTLFAIEERRAGKARVQTGDLTITPMPGAGPFTIQATSGSAKAGSYVLYGSLSEEELAAITKAGSVSFAYRGDVIQLTGMNLKVALAAAEPCENDLLRTWGIDPAAFRSIAVRAKPTASPANWVQSHDYPSAALIAGEQGTVGVRLDIDATGKLLTCTVMSSSKSAALDHRTCEMVRRRARYEPARSADNTAVASISFLRFRWQIVP